MLEELGETQLALRDTEDQGVAAAEVPVDVKVEVEEALEALALMALTSIPRICNF